MEHLVPNSANYVPLSPISFLKRASIVYAERVSIVYGSLNYTWKQTYERCCKLASALNRMNVSNGDIVAALGPNIPELYEVHFAVPMAGAIISPLNIYQDSSPLAMRLKLLEAKVLFIDHQYLKLAVDALEILTRTCTGFEFPKVVLMLETNPEAKTDTADNYYSGYQTYQSLIDAENNSGFKIVRPKSELDAYSIVFTSGTTGEPKGVVHSHRGTYLTTLAEIIFNEMKAMPVFLWTVPMFHSNGWGFTWAIAALGGTNICLRKYDADFIFDAIVKYNVTNLGGAAPVLSMIANANRKPLPFKVNIMTGGSTPQAHVVSMIEELGFSLTHSYGMGEMLGPGTVCPWRPEYNTLPLEEQVRYKSLHGLNHMLMEVVDVKDPTTIESVPFDGITLGEVMFRGNTLTKGYYKNPEMTRAAFEGGWFHTGDMAVRHQDGNIDVKDRKIDLIVSGDKKISALGVEGVLLSHPSVFEAGVVGKPDEALGETVCAFVRLKEECKATGADEIIEFCRGKLPEYMVPKTVVFGNLPLTLMGKLNKVALREMAKSLA